MRAISTVKDSAMEAYSNVKKLVGIPDDAAALAAQLQAARTAGARALDEAERLEAGVFSAENFDAAQALERQAAAARWTAGKAAARLPDLERRLAAAQAKEFAALLESHRQQHRAVYLKLKAALEAAALAQAQAMAADQLACRELGEHVARANLPAIVYRGFLFPEYVELWVAEMDRVFALPKPVPAGKAKAVPSPVAPGPRQFLPHERKPMTDSAHQVSGGITNLPRQEQQRPADDTAALEPGFARVRVMRGGFSPADDRPQCHFGQIVRMPADAARRAAGMAAVEIIEEQST